MPAIARAAGAGVGSVYRQFASKDDRVAALAERRLAWLESRARRGAARRTTRGLRCSASCGSALGDDASDDVAAQAISQRLDVDHGAGGPRAGARADRGAGGDGREQGVVRADATRLDVTLVIVAARGVRKVQPAAWRRIVELAIDGLRACPA